MLKNYLHRLLRKYLSFYIKGSEKVLQINFPAENLNENKITPDFVILNGNIHYEKDIQKHLAEVYALASSETRLIIFYYSNLWKPLIKLSTLLGLRNKTPEENWVSHEDIENLLILTDYEIVRKDRKIIFPLYIPLISSFFNRLLAPLPFFRIFALVNIVIARPIKNNAEKLKTVSVIVPARNEEGNIEEIVKNLPKFSDDDELIFIEGNSTDNTRDKIREVAEKYKKEKNIIIASQDGKGKGDAIRKGFSLSTKDILMVYDADMTVPPDSLTKFYNAIINNKGEFINGSRLVYPLEKQAMRFFNMIGNKFFALSFSFLIGQRFKDTLCGTKVISRNNYLKLSANRGYFGNFDPFGDFDLIFGAAKLGLKIVEIPIRYKERVYGTTNIQRWKHGMILFGMLFFAMRKIKFL
ncbi:MAG: glycosyltransferase family 2 protein [Bacteroidales bacterium]|nr:glycosyltransferase family 2 protein [Bacteroidales bacterium]